MRYLAMLAGFLITISGTAQAGNTGKISGQITDAGNGLPLFGAVVSVPGTSIGGFTDDQGRYFLINIPPGSYSIRVNMTGYSPVTVIDVKCTQDITTKLNLKLKVSPIMTEGIVVTAQRPIVDKELTATRRTIKIENLALMPWDTPEKAVASQPGVVTKSQEFHIRGGRSDEVSYLLDGISVRDAVEGYSGLLVNSNALSDLNMLTGIFDAQYGEVMSGVIEASIKNGGDAALNFSTKSGKVMGSQTGRGYQNYQLDYGRSLLRDKLRIFGAADLSLTDDWEPHREMVPHQDRQDYSGLVKTTYTAPLGIRLTALGAQSRSQYGYYGHDWYFFPGSYRSDLRKGRLGSFNINQSLSRATFYNLNLGWFWNTGKFGVRDTFWDIGRYWWEDIKFFDYQDNQIYYDENGAAHFTAGYNPYGYDRMLFYRYGSYWKYRDRVTDQRFVKFDITSQVNTIHQLKLGTDLKFYRINNFYLYPTANGIPIFDAYDKNPSTQAVYLQDKVEYQGLVVNLGLRYERIDPKVSATSLGLWAQGLENIDLSPKSIYSPRVGLSYIISPVTTFHLGYGKYFQQPQFQHLYQYLGAYNAIELKGNILGNPSLKPPTTTSLEFGTVTEFAKEWSFDLTIYSKDIRHLIGVEYIPAVPEAYYQYRNIDNASSKGIEATIKKHLGQRFTGLVQYSYAKAEGTGSSPQAVWEKYLSTVQGESLGTLPQESIPLEFDQRNKVSLEASVFSREDSGTGSLKRWVKSGNTLNLIFQYGSGLPSAVTPVDTITRDAQDLNDDRSSATKQLDLKFTKKMNLGRWSGYLSLEILNVFNWENFNYSYQREIGPYEIYTKDWTPRSPSADYTSGSPYYDATGDQDQNGVFEVSEQWAQWEYFSQLYNSNPALSSMPRLMRLGFKITF
ncbi:MAG: hypothetical protein A2509_04435 [Candidatus Edwardsbacteria bacterium RIFOXYD12_FULL_50_11]|uniref:Uncharacterized protein n=1 Tax=Candidatus Edwardsbacteria bacterium GWF2_54_11 TaxID=1817851 RepID=A0A1F5REW5_9BACT|nr:MAG: hypothetical protein A2502_05640 [Candidatus Edwardsbacteria bacterium RifOxyC12_full_54_24]OGF07933.1 MAG: hypothetical protein A2273_05595 [Candidatus Edwardsbacteria bacterium RifOxyA12_full_54_48]OGF10181.1 MAG: hypothetical protein A3K15_12010 [Candidatus Edwardsbacteria bacterium GWE2_54_12]OGF12996.1 MAG: hypothetical protein A2024_01870 [Candidatus Edwardsbacteria bacterium GWF2_54_11]OGF15093.1 MAG: hypothetical protein A2509_04435 [Candidatus Edwardsbacteria bacterium RIFOXYD1